MAGTPNNCILAPTRFAATAYVLRVEVDGGAPEDLDFPATGTLSTTRNYYPTGDAQADGDDAVNGSADLLTLLKATLETHSLVTTATVTISSTTFLISVTTDATTQQILWDHGNTTLDKAIFGYDASTADSATVTAENYPAGLWRPQQPISFDSRDRQPIVGGISRSMSGQSRTSNFATANKEREISFLRVTKERTLIEYEAAAETNNSFEYVWSNSIGVGRRFRVYADELTISSKGYSVYSPAGLDDPISRSADFITRWDITLPMVHEQTVAAV